jgi:MFS family permease
MANLPTYAEIGITAAWILTVCRIVQGLSSMGEIMSAQVYMTEITTPPVRYPAVALINCASSFGGFAALAVASLVTSHGFNWRIAFWVGAGIAVIGSIARTRLRETPEFIEKINKKRIRNLQKKKQDTDLSLEDFKNEKTPIQTVCAFFLILCGSPVCFYMVFMYFNTTLKGFSYSTSDIIFHNLLLSLIYFLFNIFISYLSYSVHPLTISKVRGYLFFILTIFLPVIVMYSNSYTAIFAIQTLITFVALNEIPSSAVYIKYFPVLKRVTATSFLYAATRAIVYIITTFSLVYLTESFGHFALWIIMIPITIGYLWGVTYFEKLEGRAPLTLSTIYCFFRDRHKKTEAFFNS